MLGRTHIALGIASAMILTQPQTVSGLIATMAGGAVGGWIVDIDIKNRDIQISEEAKREHIYDTIIDALFVLAIIAGDYFAGNGMCQYVIENWNVTVWGALFGILITLLIGLNTKHRTFTHSLLAMAIFSGLVYLFCRPACIPFMIGYASHLVSDFFNTVGLQLFFPLKWRPCLKLCKSNEGANRIIFWVSVVLGIIVGAYLFSRGMTGAVLDTNSTVSIIEKELFGLTFLEIYLIFINLITFLGFQRNHKSFLQNLFTAYENGEVYRDKDYDTLESRFEVWILNFMVFIGGGAGLFLFLVINLEYPSGYNSMRWSFCYTSVMFWTTIYFYVCDPLSMGVRDIVWLSMTHLPIFMYLLGINAVSALLFYTFRKRRFDEYSLMHTLLWIIGALGGTVGGIGATFATRHEQRNYFIYAPRGFLPMMFSQIIFVMYMMVAGIW